MLKTEQATALFDKPRATYSDALKHLDEAIAELDRGELVKAAEKTWAATLQATNAFISVSDRRRNPSWMNPSRKLPRAHLLSLAGMSCDEDDRDTGLRMLTEQYQQLCTTYSTTR